MDHRLRLAATVFLIQFDDYQVFQFRQLPSGGTILVLTNALQVTSRGAEVELTARPVAGLTLRANCAHIDAEYDSFPDAGGIGIDYDGQSISASPKDSAYIAMNYQHSLAAGLLNVYLDYAYDAAFDRFISLLLSEDIPARKSLNGRIEYLTADESVSLALWERNLTDEDGAVDISNNFLGIRYAQYALPRTYGVTLKYMF